MTTEEQVQLLTLSGDAVSLAEEVRNSATETQFLLTRGDPQSAHWEWNRCRRLTRKLMALFPQKETSQ